MKSRMFLLAIVVVQSVLSADSINIATYSKPFVKYVGSLPPTSDPNVPDTSKMNPKSIIDRNYGTFLEFPTSPIPNVGSYFGIELPDTMALRSIRVINLFNLPISYRNRVIGHQVFAAGNDTSAWTLIAENSYNADTTSSFLHIPISNETKKWKNVKLVLTHQSSTHNSTAVSEFEVYVPLDSTNAIKSITFPAPQYVNGESINEIQWESINLAPSDNINIYVRPDNDTIFKPLSLNEPNDGSYSWNTTLMPDGIYTVKIEPAAGGTKLGLSANFTIQNYSGLTFKLGSNDLQGTTSVPNFYSSAILTDSLELRWAFATNIKKNFNYHIQYSLDSGKSWSSGGVITDTSKRKYYWKVPQNNITALYALFRFEIHIDTVCVVQMRLTPPHIVTGGWGFLSVPWAKASHQVINRVGNTASYKPNNSLTDYIVLGQPWIVGANGDTLTNSFWNKNRYTASLAISDIDNNGETEIITSSVISESGIVRFYDSTQTLGGDPVVVDIQGDGYKEIIYHKGNGFSIVSHEGKKLRIFAVPGSSTAVNPVSVADISGDFLNDYVFGMAGTNTVYVFDQSGNAVAGSPITLPDIIQSSPMAADLFNTGENNIIVAGKNNIFCFNKSGTMVNGFPYVVENDISAKPISIADIDNDGYLDIIFTAMYSLGPAALRTTKIYCVNRFGNNLAGWPATIYDSYQHYGNEYNGFENMIVPVTVLGNLSSPYVLSIDGDWHNEVVFFSTNGFMYAFNTSGNLKNGYPAFVGTYPNVNAHFGDFDNDGSLDAVIPVVHKNVIKMISVDFGPGTYNASRMPWPTYRQNVARTGIAPQPVPVGGSPVPETYFLSQNYPNPFNLNTVITFSLPQSHHATLKVFDILGREVVTLADERLNAATHQRNFSAAQLNSGVYFYTLRAGNFVQTKKMLYLK